MWDDPVISMCLDVRPVFTGSLLPDTLPVRYSRSSIAIILLAPLDHAGGQGHQNDVDAKGVPDDWPQVPGRVVRAC